MDPGELYKQNTSYTTYGAYLSCGGNINKNENILIKVYESQGKKTQKLSREELNKVCNKIYENHHPVSLESNEEAVSDTIVTINEKSRDYTFSYAGETIKGNLDQLCAVSNPNPNQKVIVYKDFQEPEILHIDNQSVFGDFFDRIYEKLQKIAQFLGIKTTQIKLKEFYSFHFNILRNVVHSFPSNGTISLRQALAYHLDVLKQTILNENDTISFLDNIQACHDISLKLEKISQYASFSDAKKEINRLHPDLMRKVQSLQAEEKCLLPVSWLSQESTSKNTYDKREGLLEISCYYDASQSKTYRINFISLDPQSIDTPQEEKIPLQFSFTDLELSKVSDTLSILLDFHIEHIRLKEELKQQQEKQIKEKGGKFFYQKLNLIKGIMDSLDGNPIPSQRIQPDSIFRKLKACLGEPQVESSLKRATLKNDPHKVIDVYLKKNSRENYESIKKAKFYNNVNLMVTLFEKGDTWLESTEYRDTLEGSIQKILHDVKKKPERYFGADKEEQYQQMELLKEKLDPIVYKLSNYENKKAYQTLASLGSSSDLKAKLKRRIEIKSSQIAQKVHHHIAYPLQSCLKMEQQLVPESNNLDVIKGWLESIQTLRNNQQWQPLRNSLMQIGNALPIEVKTIQACLRSNEEKALFYQFVGELSEELFREWAVLMEQAIAQMPLVEGGMLGSVNPFYYYSHFPYLEELPVFFDRIIVLTKTMMLANELEGFQAQFHIPNLASVTKNVAFLNSHQIQEIQAIETYRKGKQFPDTGVDLEGWGKLSRGFADLPREQSLAVKAQFYLDTILLKGVNFLKPSDTRLMDIRSKFDFLGLKEGSMRNVDKTIHATLRNVFSMERSFSFFRDFYGKGFSSLGPSDFHHEVTDLMLGIQRTVQNIAACSGPLGFKIQKTDAASPIIDLCNGAASFSTRPDNWFSFLEGDEIKLYPFPWLDTKMDSFFQDVVCDEELSVKGDFNNYHREYFINYQGICEYSQNSNERDLRRMQKSRNRVQETLSAFFTETDRFNNLEYQQLFLGNMLAINPQTFVPHFVETAQENPLFVKQAFSRLMEQYRSAEMTENGVAAAFLTKMLFLLKNQVQGYFSEEELFFLTLTMSIQ